jgi:drug/metabolite transporter (DMT)-like permease
MPATSSTSPRLAGLTPNALGSMYMVIGSLGYVTNDALIREATEEGLDVYQALCLRGLAMSLLFAAATGIRRERISRDRFSGPLIVRVAAELVATALFFGAIVQLDFANAQTILLIVPFAVTLAAALLLGESVSTRRYATVLVGFFGVLLVVQPATGGFSFWSLAVVASAACLTVREFATRRVADDIPASFVALITAVSLTFLTGGIAVFTGWNTVNTRAWVLVLLACLCLIIGYVFTIQTVRVGDLSVSAPFRYTTLLGAVVLGYAFFDEIPGALTILGCTVILVSGLYSIHLERRATQRAPVIARPSGSR